MKKYFLVIAMAASNSTHSMEIEKTPQKPTEYKGEFALKESTPRYAGFKNDSLFLRCKKEIKPNELLFEIITGPCTQPNATYQEKIDLEDQWDNISLPTHIPYTQIKDLEEGKAIELIRPRTKESVRLTVNSPRFSEDSNASFQKILLGLLSHAFNFPNYLLSDHEMLLKKKILEVKKIEGNLKNPEKVTELIHGPNGFDFSILAQIENKASLTINENTLPIIRLSIKEEK